MLANASAKLARGLDHSQTHIATAKAIVAARWIAEARSARPTGTSRRTSRSASTDSETTGRITAMTRMSMAKAVASPCSTAVAGPGRRRKAIAVLMAMAKAAMNTASLEL